jgi:predicted ester cyclase
MDENKAVVTRWADEVLNQGKLDVVDELFAEEFTWEMPFSTEPLHGPEAMKQTVATFLAAFSDFHVDIEEVLGEGDKVALKYTASGTNDGELQGNAPTGAQASWYVQHIFTLRDRRIVADVTVLDRLGLLEQLGLVEATAGAER